ncbi:hypothetical protein EMCRGX_G009943 [Ephydatia muelleri]
MVMLTTPAMVMANETVRFTGTLVVDEQHILIEQFLHLASSNAATMKVTFHSADLRLLVCVTSSSDSAGLMTPLVAGECQ